jgi:hypothetical protein
MRPFAGSGDGAIVTPALDREGGPAQAALPALLPARGVGGAIETPLDVCLPAAFGGVSGTLRCESRRQARCVVRWLNQVLKSRRLDASVSGRRDLTA